MRKLWHSNREEQYVLNKEQENKENIIIYEGKNLKLD